MLSEKGYGLDIMHLVSVGDLGNIGMAPGDATIRLREYALRWWTDECQCAAKCPHDTETIHMANMLTQTLPPVSESMPLNKWLCFEKHFNDRGGMTIHGPTVKSGSWDDDVDYTWWVYLKEMNMYVPVPMGKVPVLDE